MGRRYFYAVVDDTYRQIERQNNRSPGSWDGYEGDEWYQEARKRTGRKPLA